MFHPHPASVHPHHHYRGWLILIVLIAGLGLTYLIYNPSESLTGSVIGVKNDTIQPVGVPEFQISTSLSPPELEIESERYRIEAVLPFLDNSDLSMDEEFNFRKLENVNLVLEGYQGKTFLTPENTFKLDGKTQGISINGITIDKKDKLFKIMTNPLKFESLTLSNISLNNLIFTSSGEVQVNENTFKMTDQKAHINSFMGNVILANSTFKLEGEISSLKIEGYPEVNLG
ncbi:MAG: hypothetical protein ABIA37_00730 [Candidatus Woesearchaeota archaeon]